MIAPGIFASCQVNTDTVLSSDSDGQATAADTFSHLRRVDGEGDRVGLCKHHHLHILNKSDTAKPSRPETSETTK